MGSPPLHNDSAPFYPHLHNVSGPFYSILHGDSIPPSTSAKWQHPTSTLQKSVPWAWKTWSSYLSMAFFYFQTIYPGAQCVSKWTFCRFEYTHFIWNCLGRICMCHSLICCSLFNVMFWLCGSSSSIDSNLIEYVSTHTSGKMEKFSHINYTKQWSSWWLLSEYIH